MWYTSGTFFAVTRFYRRLIINYFQKRESPLFTSFSIEEGLSLPIQEGEETNSASFLMRVKNSAELHAFSDLEPFIDFVLDCLLEMTGAEAGSLFLWDESAKELAPKGIRGPDRDSIRDTRIKLGEGVSGWVADKRRPVLVKDIRQDERFKHLKRNGRYQSFSFISLPLLAGDQLLGVLNITARKDGIPFTEEDLARSQAFSCHIVVAYENLRVRDRLRKENEELAQKIHHLTETLKGQQSLVTVGKFASSLSHELANPLDALRRFLNLALDQVAEDSLAREYLLKAKEGIRRAIQITSGLLIFSRESARQPRRRAELHTLIEQSLAMVSQNPSFRGVRFTKQFCEGPVFVRDSGLSTVFKNLFENACHAIEGEGTVITTTSRNGKYVLISILDTGCGVPDEHKGRLFEPFFTTKDKGQGTGIGLTICREIIERSGGEITFESADKQGTTFFITLPYQDPEENR